MCARDFSFGEASRPLRQKALRRPKGKPTQESWIVACCWDECWALRSYTHSGGKLLMQDGRGDTMDYSEFWSALESFDLGNKKAWLIGWRLRYALERAGFVEALESGSVKLPRIKVGKNQGKHGGRLTWTQRILEVDLICGKNKIKVLDWSNYGVEPGGYADRLEDLTVDVAEQALRDFLGLAEACSFEVCKSTAAQLGWDHARRSSTDLGLSVNLDADARAMERRAYHGGRNEAYRLGDIPGETYSLDVRSCYAAICRDEVLPCRVMEEYRAGLLPEKIRADGFDHWITDVRIVTDEPDYPVAWNGAPVYPVGEFVTSLAWPELRHALERGRVMEVFRAARYDAGFVFHEYADWYLWARRKRDSVCPPAIKGALKSMFNASLGYTAREKYDWIEWHCQLGDKYWLGTVASPEDRSSVVAAQVLDTDRRWLRVGGEPYEAMPFLHATICSYARVRLLEIFAAAGRENVLYCDTDGILVNAAGMGKIKAPGELMGDDAGELCERFPSGPARIQGVKSYRVGANFVQSGVVRTRHSALVEKTVLTVDHGRVDSDGKVWPFCFAVERHGEGREKCVNVMA